MQSTDYRLKKKSFSDKICTKCDYGVLEMIDNIVMQCPYQFEEHRRLNDLIVNLNTEASEHVINDSQNFFYTAMGEHADGLTFESMVETWLVAGECVCKMYRRTLKRTTTGPP